MIYSFITVEVGSTSSLAIPIPQGRVSQASAQNLNAIWKSLLSKHGRAKLEAIIKLTTLQSPPSVCFMQCWPQAFRSSMNFDRKFNVQIDIFDLLGELVHFFELELDSKKM